jgi:hypothetical protein
MGTIFLGQKSGSNFYYPNFELLELPDPKKSGNPNAQAYTQWRSHALRSGGTKLPSLGLGKALPTPKGSDVLNLCPRGRACWTCALGVERARIYTLGRGRGHILWPSVWFWSLGSVSFPSLGTLYLVPDNHPLFIYERIMADWDTQQPNRLFYIYNSLMSSSKLILLFITWSDDQGWCARLVSWPSETRRHPCHDWVPPGWELR